VDLSSNFRAGVTSLPALTNGHASIDLNVDTRQEGAFIGGEKQCDIGDLIRLAEASEQRLA
jgi:hypothetical protein